ncbi:MAG TPA: hypothetical protein VMG59_02475 [Phycisphaerae bacterium]|nr:hypothetical protein [Phycisphaerae bacterium]
MKKYSIAIFFIVFCNLNFNWFTFAQTSRPVLPYQIILTSPFLSFGIQPDKTAFRQFEPIEIGVFLKNTSKETFLVGITVPSLSEIESIAVTDGNKNAVPLTLWGKSFQNKMWIGHNGLAHLVKPGDSFEVTRIPINYLYDMTLPGTYSITVTSIWGISSCKIVIPDSNLVY